MQNLCVIVVSVKSLVMLQHSVILLDDTAVSYCCAVNPLRERRLMPIETLKKAILFSMKQNLSVQLVYPEYDLPDEYMSVIDSIDHIDIKSAVGGDEADVMVCSDIKSLPVNARNVSVQMSFDNLVCTASELSEKLKDVKRINIFITDIEHLSDDDFNKYALFLDDMVETILELYKSGRYVQLNLLTDRIMLDKMNNCGAGVENITIAPNGKFYICPAFYYDELSEVDNRMNHKSPSSKTSVGDVETGLDIPNSQLLKLDHAPLCRKCDAYHCGRCVWRNLRMTMDINTPSRQQCVLSHLERNASRKLLTCMQKYGVFADKEIKQIDYLDPFDIIEEL